MHVPSLVVTFFSALLFGILKGAMDGNEAVVLLFCLPITLICTIVGLIKSEGKKKLLVIPIQVVIWLVCLIFGTGIFKGLLAIVILAVGGFAAYYFLAPMFSSNAKKETAGGESEGSQEASFADLLPEELHDDDNHTWIRDYVGPNVVRYHCNQTGESTELFEGATQIYNQTVKGSDGRDYHWH